MTSSISDAERTALQKQIDSIAWFHEFDFGNGLRAMSNAPDVEAHRVVWDFIRRHLDMIDFAGRSVLDIGSWDGYWSIYAEKRGAKSVLASDDATQNWGSGKGIHLVKKLLGSSIDIDQNLSIYELSRLNRTFDVVLCLGVYYHLVDPLAAFAQIRHCCHRDTIVVFEGEATLGLRPNTLFWDLKNPLASLFVPTPYALAQMLRATYFDIVKQEWRTPPRPPSLRRRLEYYTMAIGGRDPESIGPPSKCERMIVVCKPFEGRSPLHAYRPPFGLHRYDGRFR